MKTGIGSEMWNQKMIKSAMDNRANQLNPNNPAYWSSRMGNTRPQLSPLIAVLTATAIGAVATAATIFTVKKITKIRKEKEIDGEIEAEADDVSETEDGEEVSEVE